MKKLKVVTVVGTRPEIIRLSRVIARLDDLCDHVLVHTGQNYDYELNQVFFEDLEVRKPDHFLHSAGSTASERACTITPPRTNISSSRGIARKPSTNAKAVRRSHVRSDSRGRTAND